MVCSDKQTGCDCQKNAQNREARSGGKGTIISFI